MEADRINAFSHLFYAVIVQQSRFYLTSYEPLLEIDIYLKIGSYISNLMRYKSYRIFNLS